MNAARADTGNALRAGREVQTMNANETDAHPDLDALPWGEHAPWFVSRRRAWLHAVLAGEERAPRPA